MSMDLTQPGKAYTYKRYMRDGSVKECNAVTRSRAKKKKNGSKG
jgi:hypothetical protein